MGSDTEIAESEKQFVLGTQSVWNHPAVLLARALKARLPISEIFFCLSVAAILLVLFLRCLFYGRYKPLVNPARPNAGFPFNAGGNGKRS